MDSRILDRIDAPSDLNPLTPDELAQVAQEVRDTIISVITERGGHLASNLGVIELTLALHRVFDSPNDSIVWDTTNQLYAHKLVTGRRDEFSDIRLQGGISGFGEPSESPHDTLCAGHAGTGLSIALGIAQSATNRESDTWTIAVVGDGAMTSGSSFEALNNIVHLNPQRMIVVLNDNGMSISENIGFLTNWRKRLITHPQYQAMIRRMTDLSKRVPTGELIYQLVKSLNDGVESFILPTMFWNEMGFRYLGPVDGHDLTQLEDTLRQAKQTTGAVPVIHVVTHKGHGYEPAEDDPVKFHQPSSPLGSSTGAPTYSKVFAQTVSRLMREDNSVVGISAAMLEGTGLAEVREEFPDRVFDVGIAEQHAVSMAAGMASTGLNPFVSIYSTFLQRAFDQVVHDVCLQNLPVTLIADRAGIVGEDGKTHHGAFDLSYLRCLPNAVVAAPINENDLQHLIHTAYLYQGPFAIRIARGTATGTPLDDELREMPIGKGYVVKEGGDVAIFALGKPAGAALEAAERLADFGIDCSVINPLFVKPLDVELILDTARKTHRIVTIEENVLAGGFGSAVLEVLSEAGLEDVSVHRIGMPDSFVEHGTAEAQRHELYLDADGIVQQVLSAFFPGGQPLTTGSKSDERTAAAD
ncbi:MAG: 1-deoxy-D-xylulose-5-phosphate synthase [Chloroflexi bacterium]|nr:1-deoxy-D-xylulose-5-phosphate synthase [Chloroflexota bacterium]